MRVRVSSGLRVKHSEPGAHRLCWRSAGIAALTDLASACLPGVACSAPAGHLFLEPSALQAFQKLSAVSRMATCMERLSKMENSHLLAAV